MKDEVQFDMVIGREFKRSNGKSERILPLESLQNTLSRIREIESIFQARTPQPPAVESEMGSSGNGAFENVLSKFNPDNMDKSAIQQELEGIIQGQAKAQNMDASLIKAVVKAESGFNPNAVSSVGAQGLMQLMPGTANGLGVQDSFNPSQNVAGGTKYLKNLVEKYHSVPLGLAAYNAGPGAVDKYGGIPPYKETQNYVKKVLQYQQQFNLLNPEEVAQ
jgi:soluble lytic murein transglycosylase-like protein